MLSNVLIGVLGLVVAYCLVAGTLRGFRTHSALRWAYAIGSLAGMLALLVPEQAVPWFERVKGAPVAWALAFSAGVLFERRRRAVRRGSIEPKEESEASSEVVRFPKRAG